MKKTLHLILFALLFVSLKGNDAWANTITEESQNETAVRNKTDRYISYVYNKIKFAKNEKLSFEVFKPAFYGYLNLLQNGKIDHDKPLAICDFTLSSNKRRMWVIDIRNKKVLFHTLVAHGQGSGEEFAIAFSNTPDSHQSSLGFYVTGQTYCGNNGNSLRLEGVDGIFNSNAFDRAIVIHPADYCTEKFACENNRLGRSYGCPALPPEIAPKIIETIKDGSCLFIYHKADNYLNQSRWLNTLVKSLPADADFMDLDMRTGGKNASYAANTKPGGKPKIISPEDIDFKNRTVSSVIVIHQDSRTGISDTVIVK